jgi:hypothetical protein
MTIPTNAVTVVHCERVWFVCVAQYCTVKAADNELFGCNACSCNILC